MDRAVIALITVLLAALVGVVVLVRRRRAGRRQYAARLSEALADGIITHEEMAELDALRAKHEITGAQARMAALAGYRRVLREAVADHELTPEEDATLERLQEQLGLRPADIRADLTQLSRLRLLARIAAGDLPIVAAPGVSLVAGEAGHWVVRATLAERLAIPTPGRAALRAREFDVDSAESFSARGERDALKLQEDILPRDLGVLLITSRRTIFQGARRTLSVPHARLGRVALYVDGVRLDEGQNTGESATAPVRRFFLVDDAELTAAFALQAARLRRDHIRPATRPHRSA
jgi:hypothetical protein